MTIPAPKVPQIFPVLESDAGHVHVPTLQLRSLPALAALESGPQLPGGCVLRGCHTMPDTDGCDACSKRPVPEEEGQQEEAAGTEYDQNKKNDDDDITAGK